MAENITTPTGLRIHYVPQEPDFDENISVLDHLFQDQKPIGSAS